MIWHSLDHTLVSYNSRNLAFERNCYTFALLLYVAVVFGFINKLFCYYDQLQTLLLELSNEKPYPLVKSHHLKPIFIWTHVSNMRVK